ncbi:signal recognition particle-docking protein FtsY [Gordonia paraffinivorans]|uniref:signal recognition particle-docking protein FtsY n=1 Tax=Gordonia paraffinivorans TaxID=175628 RepID=UPI000D614A97|nr:signal recognition particle-docking protein FtsY [Gordonia paraffinivorans]PWD43980.1 signal recognition particle-docking protein FtsY [Gordonia paraffinivorans]
MNTGIIIGIVVAVLVVAALIALGLVLSRRRRISLTDKPEQTQIVDGTTRQVDRSGGYKAGSGFTFSRSDSDTALAEPPKPAPRPAPKPEAPIQKPVQPVQERTDVDGQPGVGDDAAVPRDSVRRPIQDIALPDVTEEKAAEPEAERPEVTEPEPEVAEKTAEETAAGETITDEETATAPEAPAAPAAPETSAVEPEAPAEEAVTVPDDASAATAAPPREEIAPTAGRLGRLRGRLARSQGAIGKSVLGLLGAGDLDEESWEEIEDTLLMADLGTATTMTVVERLRTELAANPVRSAEEARALLKRVLVEELDPTLDRSIKALPHAGRPAVVLVVGVNGTGKTTTTGKLARVLVADGRRVLLGAADTFRAAAADQLQTWGERVGAEIVRGKEQADPAAVAFDAVDRGIATGVDVVMIDTAGRLHTKTGLMDELGKVKRVVEKKAPVDEVLLVLDATIGQNGLAQARVFAEVVDITGVVLTKLDGTAKGGIVFHVQKELGVPVKLVGLGEGADDLAPFEPEAFVDALL